MEKSKGGAEDGGVSSSMEDTRKRISDLPQGLLHRVLYFLPQAEVVRTSVLSKSWRYIWCTRPNLKFSETTFKGNKQEFISAVDKTLQRYCDPNGLSLEEFNLTISLLGGGDGHPHHLAHQETVLLLDKWIPIILTTTMGAALKEFRLYVISKKEYWFSKHPRPLYNLMGDLPRNKKLHFERLQVLSLQKVVIKQETFDKIISTCTLLTTLYLNVCKGLKTIKLEKKFHRYLKHFTFIGDKYHTTEESTIEIEIVDVPTLETIKIAGVDVRWFPVGGHKFTNLKSVTLELDPYDDLCVETDEICIDAPNLLYFQYSGSVIPSISFAPNCSRSNITLDNNNDLYIDAVSWLLKISQLLQALCQSEISLNIIRTRVLNIDSMCIPQPDFVNGCNKPVVVKHLGLCYFEIFSLSSALNGLLSICRPRNITQPCVSLHYLKKEMEAKKIKEYLRTILIVRGSGNKEIRQDLEAVRVQRLERFDKCERWQHIPWTAFLEGPQLNPIRFQLKWSEARHSSSKLHKLVRVLDK